MLKSQGIILSLLGWTFGSNIGLNRCFAFQLLNKLMCIQFQAL